MAQTDILDYVTEEMSNGREPSFTKSQIKTIINDANKNSSNKYYKELTDEGIITKNGFLVSYSDLGYDLENGSGAGEMEPKKITLGSLGEVEVVAPENTQFSYDENSGDVKAVPPEIDMPDDPEDMEGAENIKKPKLINFTIGEIQEETEDEYKTIEYEEVTTKLKRPVDFKGWQLSKWNYTEEAATPQNAELTDIEQKQSNYIAYQKDLENRGMEFMGVESPSLVYYNITNNTDDTESNAIYLAAFLQNIKKKTVYVAKWDGSKYVKENLDSNIAAVDNFTEVVTTKKTKQIHIVKTNESTFIPIDSLTAEEGMTWNEWFASDYNTTDFVASSTYVYDEEGNPISKNQQIADAGKYMVKCFGEKCTAVIGNNEVREAFRIEYLEGMTWRDFAYSEYFNGVGIEVINGIEVLKLTSRPCGPSAYHELDYMPLSSYIDKSKRYFVSNVNGKELEGGIFNIDC